jgi:hypothetical protein
MKAREYFSFMCAGPRYSTRSTAEGRGHRTPDFLALSHRYRPEQNETIDELGAAASEATRGHRPPGMRDDGDAPNTVPSSD